MPPAGQPCWPARRAGCCPRTVARRVRLTGKALGDCRSRHGRRRCDSRPPRLLQVRPVRVENAPARGASGAWPAPPPAARRRLAAHAESPGDRLGPTNPPRAGTTAKRAAVLRRPPARRPAVRRAASGGTLGSGTAGSSDVPQLGGDPRRSTVVLIDCTQQMSGSRASLPKPGPGFSPGAVAHPPVPHRTWRAGFQHHALRQVVHSHFSCYSFQVAFSTVSFILSLHRGLSLPLHGARVAPERDAACSPAASPVNGSPVLRVLSTGLTSARSLDRPRLGGLSRLAPLNRTDLPCSRQVLRLHASGKNPGSVPTHSPYRGIGMQPSRRRDRVSRFDHVGFCCAALRVGATIRSLAFRPATFLSTLRSGCYQTPRKTRYAAAWLRLCRGRHPRRLNSTRLQGATLRTGHDDCPSSGSSLRGGEDISGRTEHPILVSHFGRLSTPVLRSVQLALSNFSVG